MTEIDFYTHCPERLAIAGRLCAKASAQGLPVRVLTDGPEMTEALDRLLWTTPATGFLPHCRVSHRLAAQTPVLVDHVAEHPGAGGLLVNLAAAPPAFFARFERLAEIIGTSEADLDAARERYRFYRERGYVLRNHRMDKSA